MRDEAHEWTDEQIAALVERIRPVTDEELVESLKSSESVRQALTKVGLTPKGGNYIRAYKLLSQLT